MPKLLLIGDSISIHYTPGVARELAGLLEVTHHEGNAQDSRHLRENLEAYLRAAGDVDAIHFNVGLHDIKLFRDGSGHQVPLDEYRLHLAAVVERLRQTGAKLMWATTTPVIYERHARAKDFDRRCEDVLAYNAVAGEIVSAAGIPVDDLFEAVDRAGVERCLGEDGVHMSREGNALLAEKVSQAVRDLWCKP